MTSTHPLHLQSLHNHHDANPGFWGRARIFQFFSYLFFGPRWACQASTSSSRAWKPLRTPHSTLVR